MRCKNSTSKIDFYFTLLQYLKQGKYPSGISKILNISNQKIYYYTRVLKELGFIEKKGYGVWEVKRSKKIDLEHALQWKEKKIRGHAFIWKVKSKKFNWRKILDKNKIPYKLVRGYTPRIFINNKKVWLGKESIVIYENKSFYGRNAIDSRKYAVFELKSTIDTLQKNLGISLGRYVFKPTREHYGMIKNELARQCNKNGEKIIVRDDLDGEWLWIDNSEGMFGELETGGKGITQDRAGLNMNVQHWYNDNKKHNFKVTPSFILEGFNKLSIVAGNNQELLKGVPIVLKGLEQQISSHLGLIKEYRKENISWRKNKVKEIRNELKLGKQTTLNDFR